MRVGVVGYKDVKPGLVLVIERTQDFHEEDNEYDSDDDHDGDYVDAHLSFFPF